MSLTQNIPGKESFRDSVATISKEGKRNYINPKKPYGKFYNLRTWFSIFYLLVFFTLPFIKVNGDPLINDQCPGTKVHFVWYDFLAAGFFHFRNWDAYVYCICYFIYRGIWKNFLWLGLPANNFYGNGVSEN